MAIRCAAKALIVKDGRLLLNRCRRSDGGVYYDLPGGGQNLFESMEDAVIREVREEAGLSYSRTPMILSTPRLCTKYAT